MYNNKSRLSTKKIKLQVLRENHNTRQCVHLQICMVLMNQEIPRL